MITIERVKLKNILSILKLHVFNWQKNFVASNLCSTAEAFFAKLCGLSVFMFGIFQDHVPIGFLMIAFDSKGKDTHAPSVSKGNYNLWRFMIDRRYQNQGYGKQAMKAALDFIKTFPCGPADFCYLSYEKENDAAKRLYHSFGFYENGETDGDETVAVLKLK